MPIKHLVLAIVIGAGMLFLVLELVRRRKLLEEYAILWVVTGVVLLIFGTQVGLLRKVANLLSVQTPAFVLMLFGMIFLILVCLHFSIKLTSITHKLKNLAQEVALLKHKASKEGK